MSGPSHSSSSSSSSQSSSALSASSSLNNQSLRWSLQNFPVPVQLQARIPRSPLSVAQELLPNFPTQLTQQHQDYDEQQQQQPQQYQLSLQQHLQQQLQQQFQRQLQLNLQGGGESSRPTLPEPPDTILDMDMPGGSGSGGVGGGAERNFSSRLRGGISSSHVLEALLRTAQAASAHQRNANNNGSGGLNSQDDSSDGPSSLSRAHSHEHDHGHQHHHPHHHHHHHHHGHSHNYQNDGSAEGGSLSEIAGGGGGNGVGGVGGGSGIPLGANGGHGGGGGAARNGNGGPAAGLAQATELTLLYKWVAESGIFILLLFLHFLYDHRLGLLVFLCLGGTFYYTNMKLVHAIHQSAVREQSRSWLGLLNLMWLCGFLILNIAILYYVFSDQQLWRLLFFQMAVVGDISVWTLLWLVVMTDYIVKFLTVISKSLLAMMQPCCKNYRRRGKYYLLIESISQLYRQLVTVVPWLYYLNDSTRTSLWFAFITEAVYLGFKGWSVWGAIQFLYSAFQRFQSNTSFGTKPSSSDLLERGNQCPICQDSVNEPVMLPCKHIFCEQCVSIWFDREKTCPMCRAEITTESPMWKDGNTSPHLQWH